MYDNTTASSDSNGKPFQLGPLRRAIDPPGLMQASSSNNRLGDSNSFVGNSSIQPRGYTNAQAQVDFNDTSPYVPAPENSSIGLQSCDPGRVTVPRTTNAVSAYQSSDGPNKPQILQSSLPYTQISPCLAGTPDTICCCQTCGLKSLRQDPLGVFGISNQSSAISSQPVGFGLQVGNTGLEFDNSAHAFEISQPTSFTPYHPNASDISQYNKLYNSSLQNPFDNSSANFNSSFVNLPHNYGSWGTPSIDQSASSLLPDRTGYVAVASMPQYEDISDQPPRQYIHHGTGFQSKASQRAGKILSCTDFLEAQRLLSASFDNNVMAVPKNEKQFAASIGISTAQLRFCISARRDLLPRINEMAISSHNLGVPSEYTAEWYRKVYSATQPHNGALHDSAYHSRTSTTRDQSRPKKKRKRSTTDIDREKPYQCTRIKSDGTYCPKENRHFADWKRHEETHWPQRRWECIITGTYGDVACHFCGSIIDLAGQNSISHGDCLDRVLRMGHDFHRKDKLIDHVRQTHGCNANVDAWYVDRNSDWKRQCGFCGIIIDDWDTRCAHVGQHFTAGKRMNPDWKDPWPTEHENQDESPDEGNDDDNGSEEDDSGPHYDAKNNSNNMSNPRPGNDPRGGPGYGSGKRSRRSHENAGTRRKYPHDDEHVADLPDGEVEEAKDEVFEPTEAVEKITTKVTNAESDTGQPTTTGFKFVRKLGCGSFGTVDEVFHTSTKIHFARKTIRASLHQSHPALAQARREVLALCKLRHIHIIGVVAYYAMDDKFSIIMSPVAEENLSEYMRNDCSPPLAKSSLLSKWIGCLASAVSYIHSNSWQHLDIKPSNVLVTRGHVMLSDFGGALLMDDSRPTIYMESSCAVTPMYCAPELATRSRKLVRNGASDIYSLGCVFLEMATVIRRQSLKSFEDLRAFDTGNGSYHINSRKSWAWIHHLWGIDEALGLVRQHALHIISSMLSEDPGKRPTAQYIEDSYRHYQLFRSQQEDKHIDEEKYLVVMTTESNNGFDPMNVARRWFSNCSTKHKSCFTSKRNFFPSRILNVGTDSNFIHLQSSNDFPSPYVALSHCWGTGDILKTTSKTLRAMTQGIEISSLSNEFSDAVRITRALGLKYLWIDALCIIQDRVDDWVSESSQMHKIYSHSSLTICLASDGNAGYIQHKKTIERPKGEETDPICLTCNKGHNKFHHLCDDTPTTMLLDSPWCKRGWTLQERLLSPRVLYYSSTRMAWECGSNRTTLDIVSRMRENLKTLSINTTITASRKSCGNAPLTKPTQDFINVWRDVVKEYTKRQLTFPKDKLPALAGVAAKIASLSGQKYLAGLWSDDLIHSLLWCRDFAKTPLQRPSQYRAPSWSWAAIDSPVTWSKAMLDFPDDDQAKILGWNVTPQWPISPFGQVLNGGSLRIQGWMQKALIERSQSQTIFEPDKRTPFAFAQWDCLEAQHHERSCYDRSSTVNELWCLRILSGAGLLLRELKEGAPDTFERVGVYRIHDSWVRDANLGNIQHGDVRAIIII